MDVLRDGVVHGRRFRVLTRVDTVSGVSPAIAVGVSLTGERMVTILERLKGISGRPERIAIDNGPEVIAKARDAAADQNGVQREVSRPGKPTDTAFVEACNGRLRRECLNQHGFMRFMPTTA
jgi:putative transposase